MALCLGLSACGGTQKLTQTEAAAARHTSGLSIYVLDVGNGDATIILGPGSGSSRVAVLVDAGRIWADGGAIVKASLRDLEVDHLDYVVATHYDSDHIGGFVNVLGSESVLWEDADCTPSEYFPERAIIDLGAADRDTQSVRQWVGCVAQAGRQGTAHWVVNDGDYIGRVLSLGGGYTLTIVAGDGFVLDGSSQIDRVNTSNERSIALWASGGGFDFLVTGDLIGRQSGSENAEVEPALARALAARGVNLEVLRTGHHGGANATALSSVRALDPEVALISVSADNAYGHPDCSTLENLINGGGELTIQTEGDASACNLSSPPQIADGTIEIHANGAAYTVTTIGSTSMATGNPTQEIDLSCQVNGSCLASGGGEVDASQGFDFSARDTNSAQQNTVNGVLSLRAGEQLTVGSCGLSGAQLSGDSYLRLYFGERQVAYNDDACGGRGSRISYTVPASGSYTVRAGCYGSSTCSGRVAVSRSGGEDGSGDTGGEDNGGGSNGDNPYSFSVSQTASATENTEDRQLSLSVGDQLEIGSCGVDGARFEGDTYLRLYGPSGSRVALNDDACGGRGSKISYTATESGSFRIAAGCYSSGSCSGAIAWTIQAGGGAAPSGSVGSFDYDVSGTNSARQNVASRSVQVNAGQTIQLGTCSLPGASASGDTYLRIYGPSGAQVGANDDACGYASYLSHVASTSGSYELRVGCYGSGACSGTAAYRVD